MKVLRYCSSAWSMALTFHRVSQQLSATDLWSPFQTALYVIWYLRMESKNQKHVLYGMERNILWVSIYSGYNFL